MGRFRSFTVRPPKPSFTKRAIEIWTTQLVNSFGDRNTRRDDAAEWLDVSRRTIDAWCSKSDPRVISAGMLMELAIGATINRKRDFWVTYESGERLGRLCPQAT